MYAHQVINSRCTENVPIRERVKWNQLFDDARDFDPKVAGRIS